MLSLVATTPSKICFLITCLSFEGVIYAQAFEWPPIVVETLFPQALSHFHRSSKHWQQLRQTLVGSYGLFRARHWHSSPNVHQGHV